MRRRARRNDEDWFEAGQAAERRGESAAAEAIYRAAVANGSAPDGTAHFMLGRVLHDRLDRGAEAEPLLRRAIELGRFDAGADLGIVMQRQERLADAEAAYRATIDAGWSPGWAFLANVLSKQTGREDEAEKACWIAIENGALDAWMSLGDALGGVAGREADAENAFRNAINAGITTGWSGLGDLLSRQPGRETDAEQALRAAIEHGHHGMWDALGGLLKRQCERWPEAEDVLRRAIQEGSESAITDLGLLLAAQPDRHDEALTAYVAAARSGSRRAWVILATAWVYPEGIDRDILAHVDEPAGDATELEASYRQAIADGDISACADLAELLAVQRRTAEAVECLLQVAREGEPEVLVHAALLAGDQGRDKPHAEQLLRTAVAGQDPTAPLVLAALLADQTQGRDEARRLLLAAADRGDERGAAGLAALTELS
jgi:TPR repeat protein